MQKGHKAERTQSAPAAVRLSIPICWYRTVLAPVAAAPAPIIKPLPVSVAPTDPPLDPFEEPPDPTQPGWKESIFHHEKTNNLVEEAPENNDGEGYNLDQYLLEEPTQTK